MFGSGQTRADKQPSRPTELIEFPVAMAAATILVTGATGFLGGAALAALTRTRPDVRLLAMVRASSESDAAERLRRSFVRFDEPRLSAPHDRPVEVIVADLTCH